jgi:putative membrane protein
LIEHYTDHAANERTYLAWIRTALAFMAFGLIVERADLLLPGAARVSESGLTRAAGLALILLGVLVLGTSTYRYLTFKRLISSREKREFAASRTDLVLVGVVALLGSCISIYVGARALGQ